MAIDFAGSTSGSTILQAEATAGGTITLADFSCVAGGWHTFDANRSLVGVQSYTWGGIPTQAREIQICFYRVSMNTSTNGGRYNLRVGQNGVDTAGNYEWFTAYNAGSKQHNENGDRFMLTHTDHTGDGHIESGIIQLQKAQGHAWFMQGFFYDLSNLHWRAGGTWRSVDAITHIQWYAPANTFDNNSRFSILYR